MAHEVAHTLQTTGRVNRLASGEAAIRRSSATDLVSSMDNTAEKVLDDVVQGAFYISNEFEERIRKLSNSERKRLRTLMTSQAFLDQEIVDELLVVLNNVIAGYVGGTVGHVQSRPCEPGDVEPVSMWEWTGDPIITDLELVEGSGESKGKLGRHSPSQSLRLFQRALIQWGCESASPGRNPLPKYGADGAYGGELRRGIRQFQRDEGLSTDGTAGPATVKAMAGELYGVNLRRDVEHQLDVDRGREQLEAQEAADAEFGAYEDRIEEFTTELYDAGEGYTSSDGVQYEINAAKGVAQKIERFGADIISEGLERVQLGNPSFYEHVLFGGRLITSLQEIGVFGVTYKAPNDADFRQGFTIESNELEHQSPLVSPQFSKWDIPEIAAGFTEGTANGVAKGFAEAVKGIVSLFTPEFWTAMYQMVPKLILEPKFRFEIGRASAEMLHKQLTALNTSKPYRYGEKLGVLFGMLVFEIAVGVLTGGAGAAAMKGLDGAELLSKFPRLERLAKRIASTSLVRAGVRAGSKLVDGATAVIQRVDELVARVRKLLPDLTSNAKIGRQLDEFADADMLAALATKKELTRKLDALELEHTKLELALDQPEPDVDQVERLATSVERKANELEDLVARKRPGKQGVSPALVSKQTLALVEEGRDVQKLSKLPPEVLSAELHYVHAATGRDISLDIWGNHFSHEVELPNRHVYRRDEEKAKLCRFSPGDPNNCIKTDKRTPSDDLARAAEGGASAGAATRGAELLDPATVRFSQNSIKPGFKNPEFGTIDDLAEGLRTGTIDPAGIDPVRVVEREGKLISIDNRRLEAFRRADVPVRTRGATPAEIKQAERQGKFSAGPLGSDTIRIRGERNR